MSDSHRSYHLRAPLRQESSRMLWSGESELWRLQVHETSENQWFYVMFSVFVFKHLWPFFNIMLYQIIMTNWVPQKWTDCSKSHGKGEREEHYALVYLANLYFEAASHYKTPPAAKDPISQHFVCPCRPCFKVLPMLKEPADQWCLCSLSCFTWNTFWTCYKL